MSSKIPDDLLVQPKPLDPVTQALEMFLEMAETRPVPRVTGAGGLMDFIPRVSPQYEAPVHLGPLVAELEKAHREPVRIVCHAPPRHGKPLGKDTRVTMADGSLKRIAEIHVGDVVVSGYGRPARVTAVYDQGRLPVYRMRTRGGREVIAEGTHRFLLADGWLRVEQIADRVCHGAPHRWRSIEVDPRLNEMADLVRSVEPAGEEHCFCITVDTDESFIAEELVTHNTETVLHAIVWYLLQRPELLVGYATYGADLSYSKSRECRALARLAGVELSGDAQGVKEWRTRAGGGLLATGVGGPFTGFGVGALFIDDPYKNRIQAESATYRGHVMDWYRDVARTRIEPGGSIVVFATRWYPDDLSGELIKQGWRYIRLPALADGAAGDKRTIGQALWPARYAETALQELRRDVGEYTWSSLFQGLPRPRGGSVFHENPKTYTAAALAEILARPEGWRKGIGVDFAYTKKTSADYSALITGLGFVLDRKRYIYVLDAVRKQLEAPAVAALGRIVQQRHGGARCPAMAYVSTTERGVAALMAGYGFKVEAAAALADKFTRAQPYAASWNDSRVLLPEDVGPDSWVNVFLGEHLSFTGNDDDEDDQVDAGAAMHDLLARASVGTPPAAPPVRTSDPDRASLLGGS